MRGKNISGNRYGRLVALKQLDKSSNGDFNWECICDCGNKITTTIGRLNFGQTKSCGCLKKEICSKRLTTHGMTKTKEYKSWAKMVERCSKSYCKEYANYGAKGVSVQENWINSFQEFLDHVGFMPKDGKRYTIDRKDNSLGYVEGNIRWATNYQQARNKTKTKANTSGMTGVKYDIKSYDKQGNPRDYWVANWYNLNGKIQQKSFSIKKYGEELAKFLAEETRDLAIMRLSLQGAGYTDRHGK